MNVRFWHLADIQFAQPMSALRSEADIAATHRNVV
jgi:hypothetical protein